ncbi:MAG: DUF3043 domain-containing protein, partial [Bowdeniella nasicola]|nr:DUF3043 domain-containing protein [Bowdeniella nasicola]
MIFRKKVTNSANADATNQRETDTPGAPKRRPHRAHGKGRPTPKRKEAEARNYRPPVGGKDRKAAKAEERRRRNELYARQRQAMITGDERYMPLRDRGRPRRFARDYVDARWNIGELFMPLALVMILTMLFARLWPAAAYIATIGMYVVVFGGIIDALFMVWMLRRRLQEHYDA